MTIKKGDWVRVNDPGLLMLMKFAPNAKPQNIGVVVSIDIGGEAKIEFPIGEDKMSEHSQTSFYHVSLCHPIVKPDWINL